MRQNKVLVIGLDGATFDLIKPWVKDGKLPTLKRVMENGTHGVLLSSHQSNSPQAWTSFMTGKNAGKHGIFDFVEPNPDGYDVRFINASYRNGKTLWRIISDAGKKVVVVNVPITFPAEEVNGCLISGWDAPGLGPDSVYPPDLLREINKAVGNYILEPGVEGFIHQGRRDLALNKMYESIENRLRTVKYLLKNKEWDFFMVVFSSTDRVQHYFWKYINPSHPNYDPEDKEGFGNAIYSVYEKLDNVVNDLISELPEDDTVFIVSDHGSGPSSNKTFYINHWLAEQGFLRYASNNSIKSRTKKVWHKALRTTNLLLKGFLSRRMKEKLVRAFPGLRNRVDSVLSLSGIDWENTRAYSRENSPTICINLKGREPKGIVEPGDAYEKVREDIINKLLLLKCPQDNEPIVERVLKKEEMYSGKFTYKAPDLLIQWKNDAYIQRPGYTSKNGKWFQILSHKELEWAERVSRPSGIHRREGIFLALGRNIKQALQIQDADIVDIFPTALYAMGIPNQEDIDGKVLTEIFKEDFIRDNPVKISGQQKGAYSPPDDMQAQDERAYSDSEAALIEERLKGLGYID
jgi:predicted AlkP superfamily phosphohydrolase/phosphomutase